MFSFHFDTFEKIPHMMIPSNNGTWQCLCNKVVMHSLCFNLAKHSKLKQVASCHVNAIGTIFILIIVQAINDWWWAFDDDERLNHKVILWWTLLGLALDGE
jgi:hypothetical protein